MLTEANPREHGAGQSRWVFDFGDGSLIEKMRERDPEDTGDLIREPGHSLAPGFTVNVIDEGRKGQTAAHVRPHR